MSFSVSSYPCVPPSFAFNADTTGLESDSLPTTLVLWVCPWAVMQAIIRAKATIRGFIHYSLMFRFCIRWCRRVLTTPSVVAQHTILLAVRTLKNMPKMGSQKKLGAPCLSARCANGGAVSKKRRFVVREKSNVTVVG